MILEFEFGGSNDFEFRESNDSKQRHTNILETSMGNHLNSSNMLIKIKQIKWTYSITVVLNLTHDFKFLPIGVEWLLIIVAAIVTLPHIRTNQFLSRLP
jgi:hypothetical protein